VVSGVPIVVHDDPPTASYWKVAEATPDIESVSLAVTGTDPETVPPVGEDMEPEGPPVSMASAAVVCVDSTLPALSTDQYVIVCAAPSGIVTALPG